MTKQIIVISGGADGLGKAVAKKLAPKHRVIILGRDSKKTESVAQQIKADFAVCDVTKPEQIERAAKKILKKYKRIDCLINNAGIWIQGPLEKNSVAEIEAVLATNTLGTILLTKSFVRQFKRQKSGKIINVISQAGLYAKAERSVYAASKWAITGFTKALAEELLLFHVGVTGLYPGAIRTNLFKKAGIERDLTHYMDVNDVAGIISMIVESSAKLLLPEVGVRSLTE